MCCNVIFFVFEEESELDNFSEDIFEAAAWLASYSIGSCFSAVISSKVSADFAFSFIGNNFSPVSRFYFISVESAAVFSSSSISNKFSSINRFCFILNVFPEHNDESFSDMMLALLFSTMRAIFGRRRLSIDFL